MQGESRAVCMRKSPGLDLRMRIWFPTIAAGSGADVYVERLSSALKRRGIDAIVTWFPRWFELCPWLLRSVSPPPATDIIHVNSWHGPAFYRKDIPLVVTCHNVVHSRHYLPFATPAQRLYHRLLVKRWEAYSLERAAQVIAVSRFTADCIREVFDKPSEVIYNWVDFEMFLPAKAPMYRNDGPFRLFFLGNPIRRKGFDIVSEIMQRLGAKFVLHYTAGRFFSVKGLPSNMICVGRLSQEDVVKELQTSHALLFPSRFEGFGYALLEAMACGVPVVAARSSAIPEVVEDGRTGILCDVDDIDGFVQACRFLANDMELWHSLRENARKVAISRFNEDVLLKHYIDIYNQLKL